MHTLASLAILAFAASTLASPVPQELDLAAINALPSLTTQSIPIGLASQVVSVDQASVIASVISVLKQNPAASTIIAVTSQNAKRKRAPRKSTTSAPSTTTVCCCRLLQIYDELMSICLLPASDYQEYQDHNDHNKRNTRNNHDPCSQCLFWGKHSSTRIWPRPNS